MDRDDLQTIALNMAKISFVSVNESDRNGEAANLVDGLFFIGRAIYDLAEKVEHFNKPDSMRAMVEPG